MADIELVVEVDSAFSEVLTDPLVELEGSLDDVFTHFTNLFTERFHPVHQMAHQECFVNSQ